MPRDLPVGNEKMLVSFDSNYIIRDIYYPYIGRENHSAGHEFRVGVWVNGQFSWVDSQGWSRNLKYLEDTLVTDVTLRNEELGLQLHFSDAVDFVVDVFLRSISVQRISGPDAEVRLFFHHDFHLYGNDVGDTAFYDPQLNALIHYKDRRYFIMDGGTDQGENISQFACGLKEFEGKEGTWKDAEDGILSGNAISEGSVDSVLGITFIIPSGQTRNGFYFMAAGQDYKSIDKLQNLVKSRGVQKLLDRTASYWKLWATKEKKSFADLDDGIGRLYRRSLLSIMTNVDSHGGIIAGNDTDLLRFNRDTYSYIWPRDGALVAMALDNAGYYEPAARFYELCSELISSRGYFLQKYNPDGSLASSWHPWVLNGKPSLPIQEDETGLVLNSLWNHFTRYRDVEFVKPMYRKLVKNSADFMADYIDRDTGLPLDSYDLWEERRGIWTFTASAVYAGLLAASNFCNSFGEAANAENYLRSAEEIKNAIVKHLYSRDKKRFLRGLQFSGEQPRKEDSAVDASLAGIFYFGVLPPDDPMVVSTMNAVRESLWVRGPVGGLARYDGDWYQRDSANGDVQGNPWFICTLWLADWYTALASDRKSLSKAAELLQWSAKYAMKSGILAEQLDPRNGNPISVSPLTWSHAAFVDAVDRYVSKASSLRS